MTTRYLDANVFLFAALHEGRQAAGAVRHLQALLDGDAAYVTSALTVDEVAWIAWKVVSPEVGIQEGLRITSMPKLRLLPATSETMRAALLLMQRVPSLRPRDAVHAASAMEAGVFTIVSDDKDFDKVSELRREPLA